MAQEIIEEIKRETQDQKTIEILEIMGDLEKNSDEIIEDFIENKIVDFEYHD